LSKGVLDHAEKIAAILRYSSVNGVGGVLQRNRPAVGRSLLSSAMSLLLVSCFSHEPLIEGKPDDLHAQSVTDQIRALDLSPKESRNGDPRPVDARSSRSAVYLGDGTPRIAAPATTANSAAGDGYDLNFENAPVTAVAKVILGDILGVGYIIDSRVQGNVSLASGRPIPKSDVLFVLENALRTSGVSLIRDVNGYSLVPTAEAVGSGQLDTTESAKAGYGISVIPLRFVSAQTVLRLLDGFGVKANSVRVDPSRNLLIAQGSGGERRAVVDTVLSFDVDWMRSQSVGIFPVRNSAPDTLITEIEKIMDSGEGGLNQNMVKFQAIRRLNALLVVSRKPEYLKTVGTWIRRLDESDTEAANLKVYRLRYGNARQVAALLNEIFIGRGAGIDTAASQIAPGTGVSTLSSGRPFGSPIGGPLAQLSALPQSQGTQGTQGGLPPLGTMRGTPSPEADIALPPDPSAAGEGGVVSAGPRGPGGAILPNVRITADVTNNSILVYASRESHRIIDQTLRQIDRPLLQVAIDATIAEVTLNDQLTYGVQSFLSSKNVGLPPDTGSAVNTIGKEVLTRVLPGFNFLVGPEAMPNVILDALHTVTNVRILSNPSLVVLDNQVASLLVGDQIPVQTGTATVLTSNNTVVNTIDYRNTGIILRVLPRVGANNAVMLDIEQEISNVSPTSSSALTPTISNRRVKSSVSVTSGQTVLLAGLISDSDSGSRQGIPGLDKLPIIGDAFSHQDGTKSRTELIIFIRPTVVRDSFDAHLVAEELRSKLSGEIIGGNFPGVGNGPFVRP
jgi:general secretion pathway protein D